MKWRVVAGELVRLTVSCALVIEVRRRVMVTEANVEARSAMQRATVCGVAGSDGRLCEQHQDSKSHQSFR